MKEKLKAVRVEIAFLALTLAFLATFFFVKTEGETTDFLLFSVETDGVLLHEVPINYVAGSSVCLQHFVCNC